jgi:hypothetical protein
VASVAAGYLILCWQIDAVFGDLTIAKGSSVQSVLDKAGPPTSIHSGIQAGATWKNFRGSGWQLTVHTERYDFEPDDPVRFAAMHDRFILEESYYVECEVPERAALLLNFLLAPTRCSIKLLS